MKTPITRVPRPGRHAILLPTDTIDLHDPRMMNGRALCRWKAGINVARQLREEHGRENVQVILYGGWGLHNDIPLGLHHINAALSAGVLHDIDELDLVTACGIQPLLDVVQTLAPADRLPGSGYHAYVVSSHEYAMRTISCNDLHKHFGDVFFVDSGEPADSLLMSQETACSSASATSIALNRATESLAARTHMKSWSEDNPDIWMPYEGTIQGLVTRFMFSRVIVRFDYANCWRLAINCPIATFSRPA